MHDVIGFIGHLLLFKLDVILANRELRTNQQIKPNTLISFEYCQINYAYKVDTVNVYCLILREDARSRLRAVHRMSNVTASCAFL